MIQYIWYIYTKQRRDYDNRGWKEEKKLCEISTQSMCMKISNWTSGDYKRSDRYLLFVEKMKSYKQ